MCGIAGIFNPDRNVPVDSQRLAPMTGRLFHRGPDEGGVFQAAGVALGFTRLSIIDLATGNQPHLSEDGQAVSVCNGELYNHRILRRDLEQRGHSFRTQCDVEVLVHLYQDHGLDFPPRLNGQFAFALYDRQRHRLMLCRDQVGIAPLFYTWLDGELLFASEIKALLAHPGVVARLDPRGLDQILTFPGLKSPTTMFQGIHSLAPGHVLVVDDSGTRDHAYWDLDYPAMGGGGKRHSDDYYVDRLEKLLLDAVARRLDADVPVGFYLSGGLDSSLVGAMVHRLDPRRRFHSFSITFPQDDIDESRPQRLMAAALGTDHHEIHFPPTAILDRLRQAVVAAETPLKESYNTCSLALSALVHDSGHKVVLTGEGADELFAGYVGYRLDAAGPRRNDDDGLEAMLEQEKRDLLWGDQDFLYERGYHAWREMRAPLYSADLAARLDEFDCTLQPAVDHDRLRGRHPFHQRSYVDFKWRMADHLLADHGDRVSYVNGVEARYPFLDADVVDFARTLPPDLLIRGGQEKWILRQVAQRYLPPSLANREKFSFVAPGSPFLLAQNVDWVADLLAPERIRRQNVFNPDAVAHLRAMAVSGDAKINTTFDTDVLMLVLTFGLFWDEFGLTS